MERIEQKFDAPLDVSDLNKEEVAITQTRMSRTDRVYISKESIPALIAALQKYIE